MIICGDAREELAGMDAESVHSVITSSPYWGLRDYSDAVECVFGGDEGCEHEWDQSFRKHPQDRGGQYGSSFQPQAHSANVMEGGTRDSFCSLCGAWRGQFGLEPTPEMYVEHTLEFLRAIRRVLRKDGTVWWNIGDSYATHASKRSGQFGSDIKTGFDDVFTRKKTPAHHYGLKEKDLVMIPFRVALAAQADGWWVRSVIVWCLSGGVKLYAQTQKGTMPSNIKDLARLDPSTVKLWNGEKWTQVVGWHEAARPEAPLEIGLRSGEKIGCTAGHLWPTQRGNVRADELKIGDILDSTILPEPWEPQPSYIPHYLGWFVGLYIAEGSRSGDTIQIASHVDEAEKRAKRLRLWACNAFGGKVRWHKTQGNSAVICIESKMMNAIVDMYVAGRTAKDKHLTRAAWHRNDRFLRELLQGYLEGDGHRDKTNDRWRLGFCRNDDWAADLRTICARLDIQLRLKTSQATYQGGTKPSYKGEIRFERSTHLNAKADTEVVAIGRSRARKFWDIEVEDEPHLFALASGVLTHNSKPNPMPESVRDRPTTSHEYILLLTKSGESQYWTHRDNNGTRTKPKADWRWVNQLRGPETDYPPHEWKEIVQCPDCHSGIITYSKMGISWDDKCERCGGKGEFQLWKRINLWQGHDYFYDADAIRESAAPSTEGRDKYDRHEPRSAQLRHGAGYMVQPANTPTKGGRNKRTVWTIATQPYPEAHFATFPEALVEPMILTTPTKCCAECGAGWERVIDKIPSTMNIRVRDAKKGILDQKSGHSGRASATVEEIRTYPDERLGSRNTLGFRPTCSCNAGTKPAVVVDPFAGRGTVAKKAREHGRDYVVIDMNPDYIPMMKRYLAIGDKEVETEDETWVQKRLITV